MQMVHVEDRYIEKDGKVMEKKARKSKHGFAILSILFYVDPLKPQVTFCEHFSIYTFTLLNVKTFLTQFLILIFSLYFSEPRTIVGKSS